MDANASGIGLTAPARLAPYLLLAASLAVLLVFILLAPYAHPSSDDFCMASGVSDEGLFTHLWNHYFEWSGRYSSNALYAIYPVIAGLFDGYKYIPAIVLASLFLASAFFLSTLFATRLLSRPVMLASLCFVSVYVLGMLSPASGLYWMAGAFTYQSANVLLLVALALMIRLADRQRQGEPNLSVLAVLLLVVVVAVGANETGMLALTAVAALAALLHLRSGWGVLWPWLAVLAVSLLGFAVVYLSPGNEIRAADFPLRHDWSRSLRGSLSVGAKVLWIWISNPVWIVASLLAPFAFTRLYQQAARRFTVSATTIAVFLLCTFAMPFVLQFPAWWAMGGWPPARTLDAVYFLFLVGWFVSLAAITVRFTSADRPDAGPGSHGRIAAVAIPVLAVLFSVAVLGHHAFRQARTDLVQRAPPYHDYLEKRYERIAQALANGERNLVVADFAQPYPRTLYFNDIMRDPGHWRNLCYAGYFGLESIMRDKSEAGPE